MIQGRLCLVFVLIVLLNIIATYTVGITTARAGAGIQNTFYSSVISHRMGVL